MIFIIQYNVILNVCTQQPNFLPEGKMRFQEKKFL